MKYVLTDDQYKAILEVFLGSPYKLAEPYIEMMKSLERILENVEDKAEEDSKANG